MRNTKNAWINGLFLVVTLFINTLGALGVLNGLSQKEISDMYITLITPSPSTFSIWSLIYALLIISIIVMIVKKKDLYYQSAVDELSGLFRISCLFNMAWIVTFSFVLIELSVILILGLAITLSLICLRLKKMQEGKRFLLPITFGLYTGWLFIASVVNVSSALVKMNWNGFGISVEIWSIITLIVAVILIFIVMKTNSNVAFPLPIAWAYWGIYKVLVAPEGFNGEYGGLQITIIAGIVVLILMAAMQLYQNGFGILPTRPRRKRIVRI